MPAALNTPKGRPELRDSGVLSMPAALDTPKERPEQRERRTAKGVEHKQTQTNTNKHKHKHKHKLRRRVQLMPAELKAPRAARRRIFVDARSSQHPQGAPRAAGLRSPCFNRCRSSQHPQGAPRAAGEFDRSQTNTNTNTHTSYEGEFN